MIYLSHLSQYIYIYVRMSRVKNYQCREAVKGERNIMQKIDLFTGKHGILGCYV